MRSYEKLSIDLVTNSKLLVDLDNNESNNFNVFKRELIFCENILSRVDLKR